MPSSVATRRASASLVAAEQHHLLAVPLEVLDHVGAHPGAGRRRGRSAPASALACPGRPASRPMPTAARQRRARRWRRRTPRCPGGSGAVEPAFDPCARRFLHASARPVLRRPAAARMARASGWALPASSAAATCRQKSRVMRRVPRPPAARAGPRSACRSCRTRRGWRGAAFRARAAAPPARRAAAGVGGGGQRGRRGQRQRARAGHHQHRDRHRPGARRRRCQLPEGEHGAPQAAAGRPRTRRRRGRPTARCCGLPRPARSTSVTRRDRVLSRARLRHAQDSAGPALMAPPGTCVARSRALRRALAGQQRQVERGRAFHDDAVGGHRLARLDQNHVATARRRPAPGWRRGWPG